MHYFLSLQLHHHHQNIFAKVDDYLHHHCYLEKDLLEVCFLLHLFQMCQLHKEKHHHQNLLQHHYLDYQKRFLLYHHQQKLLMKKLKHFHYY
jgi:hypothetical protein